MYFSFSMRFFVEIEVIIALLPERTSNFWLGKQFLLARIAWCAGLTRTGRHIGEADFQRPDRSMVHVGG